MGFEEVDREIIEEMEISPSGLTGTKDFLRQLPYDSEAWFSEVSELVRGMAEIHENDYSDGETIAVARVEKVRYHHPTTHEFKVTYEGTWDWAKSASDETDNPEKSGTNST